jgi:ABC-type Na+ transport system ATPase subunit NatA
MGRRAGALTIVPSSHLIADTERVCDHLILLAVSPVQLCGDTETLLAQHRILAGPRKDTAAIAGRTPLCGKTPPRGRPRCSSS